MLKGRVALITGATSGGMGRSTALTLAREGADIVLNYGTNRQDPQAEEESNAVRDAIEKMGQHVMLIKADTREEDQVASMVSEATSQLGKIDILINNASGGWDVCDYTEITAEHWRRTLGAQIDGAFLTMKHIVPGMRKRSWGRVVHIGMHRAIHMRSVANVAADYCLGKAARSWMTTALGLQELKHGITVNCIEPGVIGHLSFAEALRAAEGKDESWQRRDHATPQDVAEVIAFLCSEAARFISGSTISLPIA